MSDQILITPRTNTEQSHPTPQARQISKSRGWELDSRGFVVFYNSILTWNAHAPQRNSMLPRSEHVLPQTPTATPSPVRQFPARVGCVFSGSEPYHSGSEMGPALVNRCHVDILFRIWDDWGFLCVYSFAIVGFASSYPSGAEALDGSLKA